VHRHKKPSHFVGLKGDDAVVAVSSDGAIGAIFDAGVGQQSFEQRDSPTGHFGVINALPQSLLLELLDCPRRSAFATFAFKSGIFHEHLKFLNGIHLKSPL
jgi:hypothetical protein